MNKNAAIKLGLLLLTIITTFYLIRSVFFNNQETLNNTERLLKNKIIIINVLDQEDYDDAHIKNSLFVPIDELPKFISTLNKNTILVFYCANYFCTSSDEAAILALENNFGNVYVYKAGMADWYQLSKENSAYLYDGPAEKHYLNIVIAPKFDENDIKDKNSFNIITGPELLEMIKKYDLDK